MEIFIAPVQTLALSVYLLALGVLGVFTHKKIYSDIDPIVSELASKQFRSVTTFYDKTLTELSELDWYAYSEEDILGLIEVLDEFTAVLRNTGASVAKVNRIKNETESIRHQNSLRRDKPSKIHPTGEDPKVGTAVLPDEEDSNESSSSPTAPPPPSTTTTITTTTSSPISSDLLAKRGSELKKVNEESEDQHEEETKTRRKRSNSQDRRRKKLCKTLARNKKRMSVNLTNILAESETLKKLEDILEPISEKKKREDWEDPDAISSDDEDGSTVTTSIARNAPKSELEAGLMSRRRAVGSDKTRGAINLQEERRKLEEEDALKAQEEKQRLAEQKATENEDTQQGETGFQKQGRGRRRRGGNPRGRGQPTNRGGGGTGRPLPTPQIKDK